MWWRYYITLNNRVRLFSQGSWDLSRNEENVHGYCDALATWNNFAFVSVSSGIPRPETSGQRRTCRTTGEDTRWGWQWKNTLKNLALGLITCPRCWFYFFLSFLFVRISQMRSAPRTKWTTCSFISTSFPLHPTVSFYNRSIFQMYGWQGLHFTSSLFFSLSLLSSSLGTDIYIESFLKEWKTDYKRLERVHSYIQWYVHLLAVSSSLLHRSCNNSYK